MYAKQFVFYFIAYKSGRRSCYIMFTLAHYFVVIRQRLCVTCSITLKCAFDTGQESVHSDHVSYAFEQTTLFVKHR